MSSLCRPERTAKLHWFTVFVTVPPLENKGAKGAKAIAE